MQKEEKVRISALFVLKAICAFMVLILHTPFMNAAFFYQILVLISTIAVPLFFMITGYFLYTDDNKLLYNRSIKTLKKTIPIYLICNIIYLPFAKIPPPNMESYIVYLRWFF